MGCSISQSPWGSAHPTSLSINVRQKSVFVDREMLVLGGQLSKPYSYKTFDITDILQMHLFCRWEKHTRKCRLDCNGKFIRKKLIFFIMYRKMCIIFSKNERSGLAHSPQQWVWVRNFNNVLVSARYKPYVVYQRASVKRIENRILFSRCNNQ